MSQQTLGELADTIAGGNSVWFVGSGFSYDAGVPNASKLALNMIRKAVVNPGQNQPVDERIRRYETLKQLLLEGDYGWTKLQPCQTLPEIEVELNLLESDLSLPWEKRPAWLAQLLDLGKVSDFLHRTSGETSATGQDIAMAALMGLEEADWSRPPTLQQKLLALMMLEGMISEVITTNYDSLIEDAYRQIDQTITIVVNQADYRRLSQSNRTLSPSLYKIHGCKTWYLDSLNSGTDLASAAGALVVTDRQLQYWRDSRWSWAKDLFQDRLRYRPFIFVGFSGADSVLKATLNAVAEELPSSPPKMFVASPKVSFAFYQIMSLDDSFDPLQPQRVLKDPAKELLKQLYPASMGALFRDSARVADRSSELWNIAQTKFDCPSPFILRVAFESVGALLHTWAAEVAAMTVQEAEVATLDCIQHSPMSRILSDPVPTSSSMYRPLRHRQEDYARLVQLLAMFLASCCGTESQLRGLSFVLANPNNDWSTLQLYQPGGQEPLNLVLVPGYWLENPADWLGNWLDHYFDQREANGLQCWGDFVFVYSTWLDSQDALTILQHVDYREPIDGAVNAVLVHAGGICRR